MTRPLTARSICCGVRGGSTEIVGTSSGTAPYERSWSDSDAACSLVRGTSTRQPNSGLVSNQDSLSRQPTISPTTISEGASRCLVSAATRASVEATVYCSVVVPMEVTATGVESERPAATRPLATSPMVFSAPMITRVAAPAWALQSTPPSCASTTVISRCLPSVSGMPV